MAPLGLYSALRPRSSRRRRPLHEWLHLACTPAVMRRATKYAIGVGALLIAINHSDAILRGDVSIARLLRMALTVTVPYAVSTASSVGALREHLTEEQKRQITGAAR
jgi:hypothetical protein